MDQFRVPQRRIAVALTLAGGEEIEGELYAPTAGRDGAPGRLGDRLNDEHERFLPLSSASGGILIGKRSIVAVRLGPEDSAIEMGEQDPAREVRLIRVSLENGAALEGRVAYTMPPERRRLMDFLNAAPRFVPLLDGETVTLINTERVVEVRRLDDPGARD